MPHPHFCDPILLLNLFAHLWQVLCSFWGSGHYFNVSVHSSLMVILVLSTLLVVSDGQDCIQCNNVLLHYIISSSTHQTVVMGRLCPALCHEHTARRMLNWFLISPARAWEYLETGEKRWELGEWPRVAVGTVQETLATSQSVSGTQWSLAERSISGCCLLLGRLSSALGPAGCLASFPS